LLLLFDEDSPETVCQVFDNNTESSLANRLLYTWQALCKFKHVKTVLIVDDDLGFAFWLGQALDRSGYETWPARSVTAARSLLAEVRLAVDLLVVNASAPRAHALATYLGRTNPNFKIIAVYDELSDGIKSFPKASAVHQKPQTIDTAAKLEWVRLVTDVLEGRADVLNQPDLNSKS
jgi:DNA-binding NtrC family response regulator